ncbi:hypothetical protein PAXRUDRAFT_824593 [Paxillus rubicundulus Ve08.2h10]|uniref:Uncharacterized protein n=1 Tax=Paxillus rubicundulus Ve08.2h10 TaxID=930991 RepID=A0A0D0E1N3_9AGAM|nr:hypothetical protein PAXRUDRAFT_824593 [Paxillus rubicundulus Ve08.2h10]
MLQVLCCFSGAHIDCDEALWGQWRTVGWMVVVPKTSNGVAQRKASCLEGRILNVELSTDDHVY